MHIGVSHYDTWGVLHSPIWTRRGNETGSCQGKVLEGMRLSVREVCRGASTDWRSIYHVKMFYRPLGKRHLRLLGFGCLVWQVISKSSWGVILSKNR
jgi:hypothetical protein